MKIENLKVGDRVKYKLPLFSPYFIDYPKDGEGIISRIDDVYVELVSGHKFYKKYIISYLEPLPPQYKEIKIEKPTLKCNSCGNFCNEVDFSGDVCLDCVEKDRNKSSIKLSELKVGDKIKFRGNQPNLPEPCECIGTINKIYSDSFIVDGNHVSEKYVICKLEDVYINGFPAKYNEISIEKEESNKYHTCPKCGHKELLENFKYYDQYECGNCKVKEKEKPAPKSFKFDISFVNRIEFEQMPFSPYCFASCFFKIDGHKITYHPDNPKNFPEQFNGKEYTIEIKEKQ